MGHRKRDVNPLPPLKKYPSNNQLTISGFYDETRRLAALNCSRDFTWILHKLNSASRFGVFQHFPSDPPFYTPSFGTQLLHIPTLINCVSMILQWSFYRDMKTMLHTLCICTRRVGGYAETLQETGHKVPKTSAGNPGNPSRFNESPNNIQQNPTAAHRIPESIRQRFEENRATSRSI